MRTLELLVRLTCFHSCCLSLSRIHSVSCSLRSQYSEQLRKLYVRLATPCPIKYHAGAVAAGCALPSGLVLRCTPIFMKPEHLLEIVKRYALHTNKHCPALTRARVSVRVRVRVLFTPMAHYCKFTVQSVL